jgi:hypothetical protein
MMGGMHLASAVAAVLHDHWVGWTERNHASLSVSACGWVQIAVAIVVFAAGIGVIPARSEAQIIGVVFAGLSVLDGLIIIPLYPRSAIIISIDVNRHLGPDDTLAAGTLGVTRSDWVTNSQWSAA